MVELLKPDLCIIGAGSGGLDLAAGAATLGKKVVLVEKDKTGGARLKTAVPAKALIVAARHAHRIAQAEAFGLVAPPATVDFEKLRAHLAAVVGALTADSAKEWVGAMGVRVVQGSAQFKSRRRLAIEDIIEIDARRYVIATGSLPALLDIQGLTETLYLTEDTMLGLTRVPDHLIVIGAGTTALEYAQAFRRLGAAVTVLDAGLPLPQEDPECVRIVLDVLGREGVRVRAGVAIARVGGGPLNKVEVVLSSPDGGEETIEGSHLLIAPARRPNVDGLALEAARVKHGPHGITVNAHLRTSNRAVYAIGDAAGAGGFEHVARHHAALLLRTLVLGQFARLNANVLPRVTFTDPELAQVGLTEAAAARRRRGFRLLRWPLHENDRAHIEREPAGHIKVVTTPGGRILGATIVGAQAGELIAPWALAVGQHLNVRAFAVTVFPYPIRGDIGKRAAMTYFNPGMTRTWVQRIMGRLRR